MATTANQREDRTSTPTSTQTLNVYGAPGAKSTSTPKPVVTPKVTTTPKVTAENVLAALGQNITNMQGLVSTLEPQLQSMAKAAGVSIDAAGNIVPLVQQPVVQQDTTPEPIIGTKDIDVLKAVLKSKGVPSTLVDDSVSFLTSLKKEGLDNDSITDIYLNNKDFTTKGGTVLTSPFYSKYGFYNDALTDKYTPSELFNAVEGYKDIANKFNLDPKFTSTEYTQKYLKNKLSVAAFNENANQARLAAVTSDPSYVEALQKMGYISGSQNLTDFFLDPDVGVEKMKQNVNSAAIALEAVRRSNANTGVVLNAEDIKKYGAELTAKGLSQGEVSALANTAYTNIANTLMPETKLSGIYEGANAATAGTIQSELEAEQLRGLDSQRRKKLTEQEQMAFKGQSGTIQAGRLTGGSLSTSSLIGGI